MGTTTRLVLKHYVQTSADFSTWTNQPKIYCDECSEGAGQIVGHASLRYHAGNVREPGAGGSPASQGLITGIVGQWVRVLIEDAGGGIAIGGTNYRALWYGIVDAMRLTDEGGGVGVQQWTCAGLAAHLSRTAVHELHCHAVDYTGAETTKAALRPPVFNDRDGQGCTSASATASVDGNTVEIFDLFGNTAWRSSTPWTAGEALAAILAANGRYRTPGTTTYNGGVTWAISAGTLLDWTLPTLDVNGMTVLDAINAIISPRRGLTWRLTVSGTTATINVRSIAASAITVGGTTLAAATDTATPDLTGQWVTGVELVEDQSGTYDHIRVVGAKPLVACSISYDPSGPPAEVGSLQAAWTVGQATTWNDAAGANADTDAVWRSFRLGIKWSGDVAENAGASGVRQALTVSAGDYTGARTFSTTQAAVVSLMEFEARLPAGEGWTTDKAGPRQDCLLLWQPAGTSSWYDLQQDGAIWSRSLSIEDKPASLSIGTADRSQVKTNSQQFQNKSVIGTTGTILATVGIREPDPLVVSWTRSSGSWPRTSPRTLSVQMPTAEQWVILAGAVKGVSGTSLSKQGTEATIRDDVPLMQSWLAFLRAYFGEPARALSWSDRGQIDNAYGSGAAAPGALVTTATLSFGAQTINAVVTRRTWRLTADGFGTSYQTDRIVPDIEAIR